MHNLQVRLQQEALRNKESHLLTVSPSGSPKTARKLATSRQAVTMLLRFAPRSPPGSSYNSKHMDTQVILVKFSGPPEANLQSHEYGKKTCRELGIQGQEGE